MIKEINHQALAAKYLEIIKRTASCLKTNPVKVLELKQGDVVLVDNVLLEVEALKYEPDRIYLTTLDSDVDTYHNNKGVYKGVYKEAIKHLRSLDRSATMERIEMKKILESGNYYIG